MKMYLVLVCIIALITQPIYSSSIDKENFNKESSINAKSKITVTGSAKITIVNDRYSKYGSKAEELVEVNGGKIDYVIRGENNAQYSQTEDYLSVLTIPKEFTIEKVFPNPFNPTVNIKYGLPKADFVQIIIYDLQGREINNFSLSKQSPGWHNYIWNGTNSIGQTVGTGVYLFTIQVGDLFKTEKITYLK